MTTIPDPATTEWVPLQGKASLAYYGQHQVGQAYYDGDCVIGTNGVLYMCVKNGTTAAPPAWPGASAPQGPAGPMGPVGTGIPMPVVNGSWIKGVGGAAVWTALAATDVPGLVVADAAWRYVGQSGQPPYENGCTAYDTGSPTYQGRFRKDAANIVHLSGLVKAPADGTVVFTLPVGYRSAAILHFPIVTNAAFGYAHVGYPGVGTVRINGAGVTAWASLDGIQFYAEA